MDKINDTDIYDPYPISAIELLGCAKNDIMEAEGKIRSLPYEQWVGLSKAREILNNVQEYLYNH